MKKTALFHIYFLLFSNTLLCMETRIIKHGLTPLIIPKIRSTITPIKIRQESKNRNNKKSSQPKKNGRCLKKQATKIFDKNRIDLQQQLKYLQNLTQWQTNQIYCLNTHLVKQNKINHDRTQWLVNQVHILNNNRREQDKLNRIFTDQINLMLLPRIRHLEERCDQTEQRESMNIKQTPTLYWDRKTGAITPTNSPSHSSDKPYLQHQR